MEQFISVGIGGFLGSCARYAITKAAASMMGAFPLGTLLSNVIAGTLIGFIIGSEGGSPHISANMKLFLTTGLLGGLSTFSTFSIETVSLIQAEKHLLAFGNISLNLCLSLLGVALGLSASGFIFGR